MPKAEGSFKASRKFEQTASDFHCIRVILRGWRKSNRLNENEIEVMTGYAGKFFNTMTPEEKADFMNFFFAVRQRLDDTRALSKKH